MRDDQRYGRQGQRGKYGQQYSFDHYDLPSGRKSMIGSIFGERLAARIRSPLFATAALLLTGAVFAGIIIASYPESGGENENIPVVKADTLAYRETPADPGGMDIPNRGTTVFSTMNNEKVEEKPPVENLLADQSPVEKLESFAHEVAEAEASSPAPAAASASPVPPEQETAQAGFKKIVAAETGEEPIVEKPEIMHKPGENPETLEFVRSAMNQKETSGAAQTEKAEIVPPAEEVRAAKVEPASGLAVTAGSYYIQLGSISAESGAASEWDKLKKANAAELAGLSYRVQKADLGARGTFYRIQAGPMSKESATSLCDTIKARKPGACLVTR